MDMKKAYVEKAITPHLEEIIENLRKAEIPFFFNIGLDSCIMARGVYKNNDHDVFKLIQMLGEHLAGDTIDFDSLLKEMVESWPAYRGEGILLALIKSLLEIDPETVTLILSEYAKHMGNPVPAEELKLSLESARGLKGNKLKDLNAKRDSRIQILKVIKQAVLLCGAEENELSGLQNGQQFLYMKADPKQRFIDELGLEPTEETPYNWRVSLMDLFERSKGLSYFV